MAKKKPKRPVLINAIRYDIQAELHNYAIQLGWSVIADPHGFAATKFEKQDAAVWSSPRGWAFARLVNGRYTDHRYHNELLDALEDDGPGKGTFVVRNMANKDVFGKPVDRTNELLLMMYAIGASPDWREMPVGENHLCHHREGDDITSYVVTRVS